MLRNSFARLPPFPTSMRVRADQLVCDPRSYVRAVQVDGRALYAPMLAWSAGPVAIGETGDNSLASLTGGNWLLQVCPDGSWVLYREQAGVLTVVPWDDVPDFVSETARHPSLAFDQSARVVLAWEDEGIIKVRRWDPGANEYVENVTFAGRDPVVVLDAVWSESVAGSDVLLFYLSADRERLLCRVQRDVYAVEYELWDFEAATVLDGVVALPWRYEVLVSDGHGTVLDPLLVSDLYPVLVRNTITGSSEVTGVGALTVIVLNPTLPADALLGAVTMTGAGELRDAIITSIVSNALLGSAEVTGAGALNLVVITTPVGDALAGEATVTGGGALTVVVISYNAANALTGTASVTGGGTYGPP